jgi:hypothetical protein
VGGVHAQRYRGYGQLVLVSEVCHFLGSWGASWNRYVRSVIKSGNALCKLAVRVAFDLCRCTRRAKSKAEA